MADYFFHYTSHVSAQMILATGSILARAGPIYLSDELYLTSSEAANLLGIPVFGPLVNTASGLVNLTKPIDVVCCMPASRLDRALLIGPEPADPFADWATQELIYLGGGRQFRYRGSIAVEDLAWVKLVRP